MSIPLPPVTTPSAADNTELKALRRLLRDRRRKLTPSQQRAAARRLCRAVSNSMDFNRARHLALYIAADGEIDPAPLCRLAWRRHKQVYLPVLHPMHPDRLVFVAYHESDRLLPNLFGIPEPATLKGCVQPWHLDLVLLPLVGFDRQGNRLGMGGGFYDRTFASRKAARWPRRPVLCGLAHRLQEVSALPRRPWDVPLRAVFTD